MLIGTGFLAKGVSYTILQDYILLYCSVAYYSVPNVIEMLNYTIHFTLLIYTIIHFAILYHTILHCSTLL